MKNIHRWDVWHFSPTRQYLICHRSGRLGDRVGYTLDFKLTHYRSGCVSFADFISKAVRLAPLACRIAGRILKFEPSQPQLS
jgi:hypothetical protein